MKVDCSPPLVLEQSSAVLYFKLPISFWQWVVCRWSHIWMMSGVKGLKLASDFRPFDPGISIWIAG